MTGTDPLPFWRFYWTAVLKDGRQIPQFDDGGNKFLWDKLPEDPVAVILKPFTKELAIRVRAASKVAALPIEALPLAVVNLGGGILVGIDERRHTTPTVRCITCGHTWPFQPNSKAECPSCHTTDDWFCPECQANREPMIYQNMILCPTCKAKGMTRGLKRIMKFEIIASGVQYDFQHWVRTGIPNGTENPFLIEYRITRDRATVRPYIPPSVTPEDQTE